MTPRLVTVTCAVLAVGLGTCVGAVSDAEGKGSIETWLADHRFLALLLGIALATVASIGVVTINLLISGIDCLAKPHVPGHRQFMRLPGWLENVRPTTVPELLRFAGALGIAGGIGLLVFPVLRHGEADIIALMVVTGGVAFFVNAVLIRRCVPSRFLSIRQGRDGE